MWTNVHHTTVYWRMQVWRFGGRLAASGVLVVSTILICCIARRYDFRALHSLALLPHLKSLSLPCCSGVGNAGIGALAGAQSLTALDVSHCWKVTEGALETLRLTRPVLQLRGL